MEENVMYVTLKELKKQPGRYVSIAGDGKKIIVTDRGVPKAQIIPLEQQAESKVSKPEFFGMWADREDMKDVDAYVRNLRKGRSFL